MIKLTTQFQEHSPYNNMEPDSFINKPSNVSGCAMEERK